MWCFIPTLQLICNPPCDTGVVVTSLLRFPHVDVRQADTYKINLDRFIIDRVSITWFTMFFGPFSILIYTNQDLDRKERHKDGCLLPTYVEVFCLLFTLTSKSATFINSKVIFNQVCQIENGFSLCSVKVIQLTKQAACVYITQEHAPTAKHIQHPL